MEPEEEIGALRRAIRTTRGEEEGYRIRLAERNRLAEKLEALQGDESELRDRTKAKLLQLDHEIDELESLPEGDVDSLRERLVILLIERHPEKEEEYRLLLDRHTLLARWKETVDATAEATQHLREQLELAISEYAKRNKLAGWLFGRTPRAIASHHLANAVAIAHYLTESLASVSSDSMILVEVRKVAEKLRQHKDTRWGRQQFLELFPPILEQVRVLVEKLASEQAALQQQMNTLDDSLESD